jgi:cell division protein FtsB
MCFLGADCCTLCSVTELILRCQTTGGVVERRFKRDDPEVRGRFCTSLLLLLLLLLTLVFELGNMGLTEVPSALFRIENVTRLHLDRNNLCSLPREIALLTSLEWLNVRQSKTIVDLDLIKSRCRSATTSSRLFLPSSVC